MRRVNILCVSDFFSTAILSATRARDETMSLATFIREMSNVALTTFLRARPTVDHKVSNRMDASRLDDDSGMLHILHFVVPIIFERIYRLSMPDYLCLNQKSF